MINFVHDPGDLPIVMFLSRPFRCINIRAESLFCQLVIFDGLLRGPHLYRSVSSSMFNTKYISLTYKAVFPILFLLSALQGGNIMNITAETILKISGAYWQSCTLHAAVELGIFTVIGREVLTAEGIGQAVGGSSRGVPMLLNALTAMGLLRRDGGGYANTEESITLLTEESPHYIGHLILHHHNLMDSWNRLSEGVKTGYPQRISAAVDNETVRKNFLMGMFTIANILGPRVAEEVNLSGRSRLLDLGGGPGTYAIHFCLKNPQLRATVLDLPTTRLLAEQAISRFGLSDRIEFVGGDFSDDAFGGPYDAAWLSQILHGEGPEVCRAIIAKAARALAPGGMILIHEFILDDTLDGPLSPALFSLNMLVGTARGRSYGEGEIREMMTAAGLRDIRRLSFRSRTDSGILAGEI
jgi:hypothetical protein